MRDLCNVLESWQQGTYKIVRTDKFPQEKYMAQFNEHLLRAYPILPWREGLGEAEKSKLDALNEKLKQKFFLKLAVFSGEEMVGWSYGWQDPVSQGDFYMAGSMILPEHRGQGLYTALLKRILEITKLEGFGAVRSRHICTNNPVLIAKLKAGFLIHGFELDETLGSLLKMIYFHNDQRRKAALFRAGNVAEQSDIFHTLVSRIKS